MADKPICTRPELLQHCNDIRASYAGQGLTLTLRQMYYQLVARGHLANGQRHYKRVGDLLTGSRYNGSFPLDGLVDRGRTVHRGASTRSDQDGDIDRAVTDAAGMIRALPEFLLRTSRWYAQPWHVSVWVEKEALAEVFEQACSGLGVGWFACKGYPSVSSLHAFIELCVTATRSTRREQSYTFGSGFDWRETHRGKARQVKVLYFGDHDPDGWEIPRSCERNLQRLQDQLGTAIDISFERVALNMDQIVAHNPPPFPAKMTSSRFTSYRDEHGTDDAWELDALDPTTLRGLIETHVDRFWDASIHTNEQAAIGVRQDEMRSRMDTAWYEEIA